MAITAVLFGGGRDDGVGREMSRLVFIQIWGLVAEMVKQGKEETANDLVLVSRMLSF